MRGAWRRPPCGSRPYHRRRRCRQNADRHPKNRLLRATRAWDRAARRDLPVKAAAEMPADYPSSTSHPTSKPLTFHSAALRQLRRIWRDAEGPVPVHLAIRARNRGTFLRRSPPSGWTTTPCATCKPKSLVQNLFSSRRKTTNASAQPIHHLPPAELEQANSWTSARHAASEKPICEIDFERHLLITCHLIKAARDGWRNIAPGITHGSPSTNTKTSRPCSIGCSPVAR